MPTDTITNRHSIYLFTCQSIHGWNHPPETKEKYPMALQSGLHNNSLHGAILCANGTPSTLAFINFRVEVVKFVHTIDTQLDAAHRACLNANTAANTVIK
jgi:hypothetical protein